MKIVDRKTFLSFPEGTLYCKYESRTLGELQIKQETIWNNLEPEDHDLENDWFYRDLFSINGNSCIEIHDLLDVGEKGSEVPICANVGQRDGNFDSEQMFAVFSKEEVKMIVNRIIRDCL